MNSKTLKTSAISSVFALTAFTPLVVHGFGDGKCGADMMKLEMVDKDKDGSVTEDEMMGHMEKIFANMDTDGSGDVSRLEWLFAGHRSDQR